MKKRAAKQAVEPATLGFAMVDINKLSPGNNQRKFFPELGELAGAIESSGWVQTLEVDSNCVIIAGERRWRACRLLNDTALKVGSELPWPQLPCMVSGDMTDEQVFGKNVAENMGRVDLRFIELARIFAAYRERFGLDNDSIGKRTGFRPETVSRYISIVEKCHPDIIARLDNGESIPVDYLIKIHTIRDKEVQKLRLEQWLGNPVTESEATAKSRQRATALSRRKMVALVHLLQKSDYPPEAIAVAQFMAGMKPTLPGKLHLKLSRTPTRQRTD